MSKPHSPRLRRTVQATLVASLYHTSFVKEVIHDPTLWVWTVGLRASSGDTLKEESSVVLVRYYLWYKWQASGLGHIIADKALQSPGEGRPLALTNSYSDH